MESIIEFLVEGTNLTILGFSTLCGISFVGSLIAASLGLGGGLLNLAAMTLHFGRYSRLIHCDLEHYMLQIKLISLRQTATALSRPQVSENIAT